jgi:hypothetical protein
VIEQANWFITVPVTPGSDPQALAAAFAVQLAAYLADPEFGADLATESSLFANLTIDNNTVLAPTITSVIPPSAVSRREGTTLTQEPRVA